MTKPSPSRSRKERNQQRSRMFEQDDDVTKKVHLEVAEFYGKLNPTTFLD